MRKWNIAVGFYQEISTAQGVVAELKRKNFRSASIHHKKNGSLDIRRYFPLCALWIPALTLLAVVGFSFIPSPILAILSALVGVSLFWYCSRRISSTLVNRFKHLVLLDEILILVHVNQNDVRDVLAILRQVKSGHPVSFMLRSDFLKEEAVEIPSEPLTMEQLRQEATSLASSLQHTYLSKNHRQPLITHLQKSHEILQFLRRDVSDAEYIEQSFPAAAEWFLDNMYIIEGSVEEIKRNLPKKYYKVLPKVVKGPMAGLPRIYALAIELVKGTVGKLTLENITEFLTSYQQTHPLTIGELWAFPLMLRLRLIEWIQLLAIRVDNRMREGELASFWGNRLLYAARHEPNRLPAFITELSKDRTSPSPHFVEELLDHLFDDEAIVPLVRQWAEQCFDFPLTDVLHQEQIHETSEQIVFSHSILSLISLSQLSWQTIFESVSVVDAILGEDPVGIYAKMDFTTRNWYREALEEIARHANAKEVDVAQQTLTMANQGAGDIEKHVGYYLIDTGRQALENSVGYSPPFFQKFRRWILHHAGAVYLGGITFLTLMLGALLIYFLLNAQISVSQSMLFFFLALVPISELSVQALNLALAMVLPVALRPTMLYKNGIPIEYKTLVVIPTILRTPDSIHEEIQRLEIRYLANTDPSLCFGIFGDFTDSHEQHLASDASLLEAAVTGLKTLETKYGAGKFFLFHRQRVWCESENAWVGWERKRGKLEYLNRFLRGEPLPENIVYAGQAEALKGTRYVITLDSDTQLPKDQAKALIEVLSHPLNRPHFTPDGKGIARGYTIIQPRVVTDFTQSRASWFCRIFSEPAAMDPYTKAISNVYQDLAGEGSYHGKGIYDVEAFDRVLSNRFPDEHLLSHDLLEGSYVRVAFASNVCLYDSFPEDYLSWARRQHRWIRGDWQILDWLFSRVPTKTGGKEVNPISWINRWKIFDNLRRSLVPIFSFLLLIMAWMVPPLATLGTGLIALVLLIPCIALLSSKLIIYSLDEVKALFSKTATLFLRCLATIALLPYEAYLSLDAMVRVAYRRLISHRFLLQWAPSESLSNGVKKAHSRFLLQLGIVSLFGALLLGTVYLLSPQASLVALPFCLLWILSPLIVHILDKPLAKRVDEGISHVDRILLRKIARQTWRYFDDFVGPQTHWLPPDNYQASLRVEVAQRTSPTNIGMWLMAVLGAYDLKYMTSDALIDKTLSTLQEMKKLERFEGHYLNWYNIQTLDPLYPRYISTVDSGNLLASLWTVKQGMEEMIASSLLPSDALLGIEDTYVLLQECPGAPHIAELDQLLGISPTHQLPLFIETLEKAQKHAEELLSSLSETISQVGYWLKKLVDQLKDVESQISRYYPWVTVLNNIPSEVLPQIDPQQLLWRDQLLTLQPSLKTLANGDFGSLFLHLIERTQRADHPEAIKAWGKRLKETLETAQWLAGEQMGRVEEIISEIDQISQQMSLRYLYNPDRKLFAIGYNIDDRKLDTSCYDLLASEARIASLVAIAKEDVPLDHWWALGRFYNIVHGRRVLLSWGGTMFEYLMPLLFHKQYPESLLGQACDAVVSCQIKYGEKRGIPWGISEAAFSAIDEHRIYQYKSFGIPGVGLKRGLEMDLVVSPYSTALALPVQTQAAIKNLKILSGKDHFDLIGPYGYYESIDFTRQRSSKGERGVIVHAFMAHHQGMIFASINNMLNNEAFIHRFHRDPRICGVNSLLYEQIPTSRPIKERGMIKEPPLRRLKPFSLSPVMGVVETPESLTPRVNLLSNEKYSLMITSTGGGYSRWRDIDISRWRSDTTRDAWGSYYYIKDVGSGETWSTTYQPTLKSSREYSVNFRGEKAEFRRKDHGIETLTEIIVSPEDDAEIRLITLINHSHQTRTIELTSYMELSLAPHRTDSAHPAFNKLFIETEAVPEFSALLAFRRMRSPQDSPIWATHLVATSQPPLGNVQYETDRSRFIGRGKSLERPSALESELSNTTGTVLDPIFSLRCCIILEPGRRVQVSFITAITTNRSATLALVEKYKDITASQRALELAWAYTQLELRHLRVQQEEVQLFQKLASRILYPHAQLRASEDRILNNRLGQSALWSQGISGDFPLVVITVGDVYDVDLVKQVLIAHAFWSLRGLKVDLVILNEEETGYMRPLHEQLQNLIQAYSLRRQCESAGQVILKSNDQVPPDILNLLFSVARAILIAARGSLRQQLVSPMPRIKYPPKLIVNQQITETPSRPLPFLELPYFNGVGGYSTDGRSYAIYLGPGTQTPAPWINVIANPDFGTMVSDAGSGCTWFGNSQSNRLTPWSNDPILNPISDVIYIRDEDQGIVWTPTPEPIRELDAYRITHGPGYSRFEHNSHGIEQELLIFVPVDDTGGLPLRIQRLRLTNASSRKRRLTATAYSEWVLGSDKEETQMHVITEWDSEGQALFAYNRYHSDFGNYVAFTSSVVPATSYTGDRTEFLGRNHSTASPEALKRKSLSGHTGAALDPCSALQIFVELDPKQETEVVFIMGYAQDAATARQLILQCRQEEKIEQLLTETQGWWNKTLGTIQVDVPDLATNFLLNTWLPYQNLSCRFWGRSGFYQSSGAYGFRDQLQDSLALLYSLPKLSRDHILKAASRQFVEGDVQHWWHPQTGGGIRTRYSDDLLWLPYVTAQYVRVTGDVSILEENITFLEAPLLTEEQHEVYMVPTISAESGTLLEHCRRSLQKGTTAGAHGLPLMGGGDWNDGMNRVGIQGKGESVWLAWFLIHVMNDFAELLTLSTGDAKSGEGYRVEAKRLAQVIEKTAWDGEWYRRAYFDDGSPLGSHESMEAKIDSLAQSWSVLSGLGDPERSVIALKSAEEHLVKAKENVVLLLTPSFDKTPLDPGYIKGYPPGVRENGGQYTHGSTWLAMAHARMGNGTKAAELLRMMAPTSHTQSIEANALYKVEPYALAADIYNLQGQVGRGGWTWYTGSAAWMYRIWLEEILGFTVRGQTLSFQCNIPKEWNGFKVLYRYLSTSYDIEITRGTPSLTLDGLALPSGKIPLTDDGAHHVVLLVIPT